MSKLQEPCLPSGGSTSATTPVGMRVKLAEALWSTRIGKTESPIEYAPSPLLVQIPQCSAFALFVDTIITKSTALVQELISDDDGT